MRSLPSHNLASLISNSIFTTPFTDFIEFIKYQHYRDDDNILISPSNEDKLLLIESIDKCLSLIGMDTEDIKEIIKRVVIMYNRSNLEYTYSFEALGKNFPTTLKFLTYDRVAMIMFSNQIESELELNILKIRMFIHAAAWLNMDEYLKYLYYLYE